MPPRRRETLPAGAPSRSPPAAPPSPVSAPAEGRARRKLYRTLQHSIGSGSQGAVRLAMGPPGVCAIKSVETPAGDADADEVVRRMRAVFAIRPEHPGVVRLLDFFRTRSKAYFVHEYCAGGDLAAYLARSAGPVGEEEARDITFAILSALCWLHAHGIVHRDLKPANVLLRDAARPADTLCLADFGSAFSPFLPSFSPDLCLAGTPFYLPPEIIRGLPYGPGVDMWSLGCIVYELLFGRHPFQVVGSFRELYQRIGRADYEIPVDRPVSPDAASFIRALLAADPEARMSAEEATAHPWMAGAAGTRAAEGEEGYAVVLNELGELVLADLDAADDSGYLSRKGSG
ncbi:kinase-like domain-containing protein [Hyaloraphidium curvatum]|nr:kinase-like domain-containing protein [Hyaloraphidium curvatum]